LNPQTPPHDKKLFTGQERDFETGQDYFNACQLRTDLGLRGVNYFCVSATTISAGAGR
jgi:hypothetical protein